MSTILLFVLLFLAVIGVLAWLVFRSLPLDDKTRLIALLGVLLIVVLIILFLCLSGTIPHLVVSP